MPYFDPGEVVGQFAKYLQRDVREAIDDEKFVKAQVGSMSSSLTFLGRELGGMHVAVNTQRRRLVDALDDLEQALEDGEIHSDAVAETVASARERVADADGRPYEMERELTASANEVLDSINEELSGAEAHRARQPLYDYMETRVQTQLDLLR
jgi:hypothetical protein